MLSIVVVLLFYVTVAILTGRGILQPRQGGNRVRRIPLDFTTYRQYFNGSESTLPNAGFFTASFKVGHSANLSLILSTSSQDILILPDRYQPSADAGDLYHATNGTFSVSANVTSATVGFEAMTDWIGIDGLMVSTQVFANMPSTSITKDMDPVLESMFASNVSGIMGLMPATGWGSSLVDGSSSWIERIGGLHQTPSNRFGLLLQVPTAGARDTQFGELYFGELEQDEIVGGRLAATTLIEPESSAVQGIVVTGNTTIAEQQTLIFASGTESIFGPIFLVEVLFNAAGIQTNRQDGERLQGFFPCHAPPQIGFGFPYNVVSGDGSQVFYLDSNALGRDIGNGTCMAVIEGLGSLGQDGATKWVIGHSFMQGKYIDFNVEEQSIGIGMLKS